MARLSAKDWLGWGATGRKKRQDRNDLEELADRPSTGKPRGRKRGRCRDGHDFQLHHVRVFSYARMSYEVWRCPNCGKEEFRRNPRHWQPIAAKQVTKADEKFFPVHAEGTCAVCDKRRAGH
jgi:hypothetical protein